MEVLHLFCTKIKKILFKNHTKEKKVNFVLKNEEKRRKIKFKFKFELIIQWICEWYLAVFAENHHQLHWPVHNKR